jgi:hypothetical protein
MLGLLSLQQIPSHGRDFLESTHDGSIDWPSLGVVVFFPAVLTLLIVERTRNRRERPSRGRPRS